MPPVPDFGHLVRAGGLAVVPGLGQEKPPVQRRRRQSVTACTLTTTWQFAVLPNAPQYIRATPGEELPSLGNPARRSAADASVGLVDQEMSKRSLSERMAGSHCHLLPRCNVDISCHTSYVSSTARSQHHS